MNVCFKCGSTEELLPFGKSAAYLAPRISLCRGCIGERPEHERDQEFDCGCTETRTAIVETQWRKPGLPAQPVRAGARSGTGITTCKPSATSARATNRAASDTPMRRQTTPLLAVH
jgi:hypothetical protein